MNDSHACWMPHRGAAAIACFAVMLFSPIGQASTAYGTLNNFDVVNDTGEDCHGFEIELEDIRSTDVTYTYDYNHYGTPIIREDLSDPVHPRVFIRYESKKDAQGNYLAYTAVPVAPLPPTAGHQCTNPSVNEGCEHFGVGYRAPPTVVRYNWLVDDGAGNLVHGPAVNISTPSWNYIPPAPGQNAQVQAVIEAPEPPEIPVAEFGEAVWVKAIKTTSHNNQRVELKDLVSDDPNDPGDRNWKNGEPDEVEVEWAILQEEFAHPGQGNGELPGADEDLPMGDEVITRRYEFFKYAGPYDPETNEVMCDKYPDPNPAKPECEVEVLGEYIGAQMAGFNVEALLGLIDNLQDGQVLQAYPERTVVAGGNTPYQTEVVAGSLPPGMDLNAETGVLSGTPLVPGSFLFTVEVTDADAVMESKAYELMVAGEPVDTESPSIPTGLSGLALGSNGAALLWWNPSTDDLGVAGYRLYELDLTSWSWALRKNAIASAWTLLGGVLPGSIHVYVVAAYDLVGHQSAVSAPVVVRGR